MDPLTAISLASCIVQFTVFGIKIVTGSVKLYRSNDGLNMDMSDLEHQTRRLRTLAVKVDPPASEEIVHSSTDKTELRMLAKSCNSIASDLLLLLDSLKVKKSAGSGRSLESFQTNIAAQMPWKKGEIVALEKRLKGVREAMFDHIKIIMRY